MPVEPNFDNEHWLTRRVYHGFLVICRKVVPELDDTFRTFTWVHEETWTNQVARGGYPDYYKLQVVLERVLGVDEARRIFGKRDEVLADKEYCQDLIRRLRAELEGKPVHVGAVLVPIEP